MIYYIELLLDFIIYYKLNVKIILFIKIINILLNKFNTREEIFLEFYIKKQIVKEVKLLNLEKIYILIKSLLYF